MVEKWIAKMHMKKGALHRAMGVPMDKKLRSNAVAKLAKGKGVNVQRARLAQTFKKMNRRSY